MLENSSSPENEDQAQDSERDDDNPDDTTANTVLYEQLNHPRGHKRINNTRAVVVNKLQVMGKRQQGKGRSLLEFVHNKWTTALTEGHTAGSLSKRFQHDMQYDTNSTHLKIF